MESPKAPESIEVKRVRLEQGEYRARTGFREFGKFESQWFSAASDDTTLHDKPFLLDKTNPDLQRFSERLFRGVTRTPEHVDFINEIDARYSSYIPSAPISELEHYEKLSDIVRSGTGTCAAKTMLLGTLLKEKYPQLQLSEIYGQVGVVQERVRYPFSHVWLRGESAKNVFLYDAMYSKTALFKKETNGLLPVGEGYKTFDKYSVEAFQAARLYAQLHFTNITGLYLARSYDQQSQKLFVRPSMALETQADGAIEFNFTIPKAGEFETFNGCVKSSYPGGASVYCPLRSIAKIG